MSYGRVEKNRRVRRLILDVLRARHDDQQSRYDSSLLWSVLVRTFAFDVSENELFTMLQDLNGRGYVVYVEQKNLRKGEYRIVQIELTPKGRDLLEGNIPPDPAVEE